MKFLVKLSLLTVFSVLPSQMATRRAYGVALAKLGQASKRVVALDGDTKNSTFSDTFRKAFPERYIECFIAEQNMVCDISVTDLLLLSYKSQARLTPAYDRRINLADSSQP